MPAYCKLQASSNLCKQPVVDRFGILPATVHFSVLDALMLRKLGQH